LLNRSGICDELTVVIFFFVHAAVLSIKTAFNLVKSVRGPGGGYLLNTQAKNISLTQIIEAVDENIDLRRCKGMNACNIVSR
jgi:DNA-binding IscR family transcriptional regulator